MIVIEGKREIEMAIGAKFIIESVMLNKDLVDVGILNKLRDSGIQENQIIEVAGHVFSSISYRNNTDGLIALARPKEIKLNKIKPDKKPLIVVLETVEKPGNLGAIARTAEAAGCDAILVCNPQTDIYNPNVIRSSLGTIFRVPVVTCTNMEAFEWLKEKKIRIFSTYIEKSSKSLFKTGLSGGAALVLGSEAQGISRFWVENADEKVIIPMFGTINSMNVSAVAAIVLYEAVRQRMEVES
ncbi:MAG: RNA methyltransferase [Bacteroidales bacterium]|nr:RNA methyltransferase [Bacteroidales bacterium]